MAPKGGLELTLNGHSSLPAVRADPQTVVREIRMVGYALINSFLVQQRLYADYLDLPPARALVFLTVMVGSSQRYTRAPNLDDSYRGAKVLPRSSIVPMSRRSIAAATNLPRETVRRIVAELIESGYLIDLGRRGVTPRIGEILTEPAQALVRQLTAEVARLTNELARLGAVVEG